MKIDPVAALVLAELARRGMTVRALAEALDVDREVLGRWLRGERTVRLALALSVLQYLGLHVIWLDGKHGEDSEAQTQAGGGAAAQGRGTPEASD
ncbi:MAG: helix-turn-helix transcriptional regulator [Vicinamibacterales bacterium]